VDDNASDLSSHATDWTNTSK